MADEDLGLQAPMHQDLGLQAPAHDDLGLAPAAAPQNPAEQDVQLQDFAPRGRGLGNTMLGIISGLGKAVAPYADRLRGEAATHIVAPLMDLAMPNSPPAMTDAEKDRFHDRARNMAPTLDTMLERKGVPPGPSMPGTPNMHLRKWLAGAGDMLMDPLLIGPELELMSGNRALTYGPMQGLKTTSRMAYDHALNPVLRAGLAGGKTVEETRNAMQDLGVWGRRSTWADTAEKNALKVKEEYDALRDHPNNPPVDLPAALDGSRQEMSDAVRRKSLKPGADAHYEQQLQDTWLRTPTSPASDVDKWLTEIGYPAEVPNATPKAAELARQGLRKGVQSSIASGLGDQAAARATQLNKTRGPWLTVQDTLENLSGKPASVPMPKSSTLGKLGGEINASPTFAPNAMMRAADFIMGQPGVSSTYGYWGGKLSSNPHVNNLLDTFFRQNGINIQQDSTRKDEP